MKQAGLSATSHEELRASDEAFTLIEMLVVVAVFAILGSLLLPVLFRAKQQGQAAYCLNNGHSIMMALQLYSSDNTDLLPPNNPATLLYVQQHFDGGVPGWVSGVSGEGCYGCVTNLSYLGDAKYAKLAPYAGNVGVYKCPGDDGNWLGDLSDCIIHTGRVRSYSMNGCVGTVVNWLGLGGNWSWANWIYSGDSWAESDSQSGPYGKITDFRLPSQLAVLMEEDEHTIVTPSLGSENEAEDQGDVLWTHAPALRHNGSTMYAFGDTHCELHSWHPFPPLGVAPHVRWNYWLFSSDYPKTGTPQARDFAWLSDHLEISFY